MLQVAVEFLEWQLPVPVIIIVVFIRTPVMHREKIDQADTFIDLTVFLKMLNKYRNLAQLVH